MHDKQLSTIFVSIASYRDLECYHTIKNIFDKASNPNRVYIGVVWQYMPDIDPHNVQNDYSDNVKIIKIDARESRGVCWARSKAQSLWSGQEFYLQVDSHSRFVDNWDVILFEEIEKCNSDKVVLSTICMQYTPPNEYGPLAATTMRIDGFNNDRLPFFKGIRHEENIPSPVPSPWVCGHFLFCSSKIILECPYDPYLYFYGEEISLASRLWTSGWDIFAPSRGIVFHGYSVVHRHWKDHKNGSLLNEMAYKRVRHLLGIEITDDANVLYDLNKYSLGCNRLLSDYERFAHIDLKNNLIFKKKPDSLP